MFPNTNIMILLHLELKLLSLVDFVSLFRPSWQPSWILKNPRGWQVATRAKFQVYTINCRKMQKNDCNETMQGSSKI